MVDSEHATHASVELGDQGGMVVRKALRRELKL